nr:protein MAK16 homolog [Ipomoea batatas]GME11534.1 protein MAK16 homolog [Ipomoea batatas]
MLRSKGVKLRDGVEAHRNAYLLRTKPYASKGKGATLTKLKGKAIEQSMKKVVERSPVEGEQTVRIVTPREVHKSPIKEQVRVDTQLTLQMANEAVYEAMYANTTISTDKDLLAKIIPAIEWQKWRISNLDITEEGLQRIRPEEEFSLEWLGTTSIPIATQIEESNKVYL